MVQGGFSSVLNVPAACNAKSKLQPCPDTNVVAATNNVATETSSVGYSFSSITLMMSITSFKFTI